MRRSGKGTFAPCEGVRKRKCHTEEERQSTAKGVKRGKWHREEELLSEKGTVVQEGGSATRRRSEKETGRVPQGGAKK